MTSPELVAYMEVLMAVDKLQPSSISQGDIEAVEDAVGSGSGAWDMVDPHALLAACAKQVLRSMDVPFATLEKRRLMAAAEELADVLRELHDFAVADTHYRLAGRSQQAFRRAGDLLRRLAK